MNLIYMRHTTPKTRKFLRKKLRGGDARSIYAIEAGDCCLPPTPVKRRDVVLTFLHDASREMLEFMYVNRVWASLNWN